jgi:hypothetical protein
MKTEHKVIAGLALVAVLGGLVYFSSKDATVEKEQRQTSASKTDLPNVTLLPEQLEKVAKIELKNTDKPDKPAIVLEKKGADWMITAPIQAKANQGDVKTLVDGLKELKITEAIDRGTAGYDQHEVSDAKASHMTISDGAGGKLLDVYFGKKGGRGQMLRVAGTDGVFVDPDYSPFAASKDVKGWRDKSIVKLDDKEVASVEIENANGTFTFKRDGDNWSGAFVKNPNAPKEEKKDDKKPDADKKDSEKKADADKKDSEKKDGEKKADADKKVEIKDGFAGFDGKRVEDLLRAYKALSAIDFADDGADTGVDAAAPEGGVVRIKMKDGTEHVFRIGKKQKGANRFVKYGDNATIFVVSSFAADWATDGPSRFEKKDDKKGDKKPGGHDDHDDMGMPDMDLDMPGE